MSTILRIEMIVIAASFVALVLWAVNVNRIQLKYSIIWLVLSAGVVLIALFPQIVTTLTNLAGIEVPANFIYLVGIISLLIITFYLTILMARQADRIKTLTQMVSIEKYLMSESEGHREGGRDGE